MSGRASAAPLGAHVGKPATFVIRPEDLRIADGSDPADQTFEALVEVAEQLGSEILLDVTCGASSMVASVDPTIRIKPGEKIRLTFNPKRAHFFDGQTEVAVRG